MKKSIHVLLGSLLICCLTIGFATAGEKEDAVATVDKSRMAIDEMMASKDKGPPADLIKKASGLAIIPGLLKGGFVVGGSYGKGVVLAHKDRKWTGPAFVYMGAGSLGLQIGVESVDLILVIIGQKTMDAFLKSKFKLGADAAIAAGPVGAQATAATDIMLKGGIYSYSRSKGLFAGVSLEGAGMGSQPELNQAYYNAKLDTKDILYGKGKSKTPESGKKLITSLDKVK